MCLIEKYCGIKNWTAVLADDAGTRGYYTYGMKTELISKYRLVFSVKSAPGNKTYRKITCIAYII